MHNFNFLILCMLFFLCEYMHMSAGALGAADVELPGVPKYQEVCRFMV